MNDEKPTLIGGIGEPNCNTKNNHKPQWHQQDRIYSDNIAISLTARSNHIPYYKSNLRIRKLTPNECWRLMGFDDEDFEAAQKVNSDTQLYRQAGNSIVVNVLEAIFSNLFLSPKVCGERQMTIFDFIEKG